MRKKVLVIAIMLALGIALGGTISVLAKGAGAKGQDITWQLGSTTYKGIFLVTGSGLVHQWRYMPNQQHYMYKPLSMFPNDPGDDWTGPYPGSGINGGIPALEAIFPDTMQYWFLVAD